MPLRLRQSPEKNEGKRVVASTASRPVNMKAPRALYRWLTSFSQSALNHKASPSCAFNTHGLNMGGVLGESITESFALRDDAAAFNLPQVPTDTICLPRAKPMKQDAAHSGAKRSRVVCNMGQLLEDRGNRDEALLCFQEASAADSSSAEPLYLWARNLQRRGDLDNAALYFERVRKAKGILRSKY